MGQSVQITPPNNKELKEKMSEIMEKISILDLLNISRIINKTTYFVATKTNNLMSKGDIFIKTEKVDSQFNKVIETNWLNFSRNIQHDELDEKTIKLLLELDDNKLPVYGEGLLLSKDNVTILKLKNSEINSCKISVNEGALLLTTDGATKPSAESKLGLQYSEGNIIEINSKYSVINLQMCAINESCKIYIEYYINF